METPTVCKELWEGLWGEKTYVRSILYFQRVLYQRERDKNNCNVRQNISRWLKRGTTCFRNMKDGGIDFCWRNYWKLQEETGSNFNSRNKLTPFGCWVLSKFYIHPGWIYLYFCDYANKADPQLWEATSRNTFLCFPISWHSVGDWP